MIETSFNARDASVTISVNGHQYIIDFIYFVQRNASNTEVCRMIFRNPRPNLPPTAWQFFHDEKWKNFNRETSDVCERAVKGGI
jgi:hypothetical protein